MLRAKRIVVLSDGTGNAASSIWRTNVWRTFNLIDLSSGEQITKYDDGVGSSSFKIFAFFAGAVGFGLKRNVIDLYKFLCRNYQPGVHIYAFGFSRGAYTIRVLISLILTEGLVPYVSEADLHMRSRDAYRSFRAERFHTILRIETLFRKLRDAASSIADKLSGRAPYSKSVNTPVDSVEFIGVWDTVAAYGLPIEEMTRGVSQWIFPLGLPERTLDSRVKRACHAIALDDERTTFHPVLWTEHTESPALPDANGRRWLKDERISQVWFAGVHSNVGGGYPDDSLAHVPLYWIMNEARTRGLVFKGPPGSQPDAFLSVLSASNKNGRQYDSRSGLKTYYRYGPRNVAELCNTKFSRREFVYIPMPKIHESVLARLRSDLTAYAPIGLPEVYEIATHDGRVIPSNTGDAVPTNDIFETNAEARARFYRQQDVWDLVWLRRIVYFITLGITAYLVLFRLFNKVIPEREHTTELRPVSDFVRLFESILPGVFRIWTDAYATNPARFLLALLALATFLWIGAKLRGQIADFMRAIWKSRAQECSVQKSLLHSAIFRIRTNKVYTLIFRAFKFDVLPALGVISVLVFAWAAGTPVTHLVTNLVDLTGVFCREGDEYKLRTLEEREMSPPIVFHTSDVCAGTGVLARKGEKYLVRITITDPWSDGWIPATPSGFVTVSVPSFVSRLVMRLAAPLRRVYFRPWFALIGRIGATGSDEDYLDPIQDGKDFLGTTIRAQRNGELFLYVNDALLPVPGIGGLFYLNNSGAAVVVITRLR